ncbi:MAG: Nif3-like dinuclear metal center hexameric protein [Clostridiaceae bacterium]
MAVVLKELINYLEAFAPVGCAEIYDNPGLAVGDFNSKIKRVLIALDVTDKVIDEAIEKKADLIFTHHPLLFSRPESVNNENSQGRKIIKMLTNGINAYSSHTNLDKVVNGMNDMIMEVLGFNNSSVLSQVDSGNGIGIGRISVIEAISLSELAKKVGESLDADTILFSGDPDKVITKVAVVNGSGADFINLAKEAGAEVLVTGDTKYHDILDALDRGICVIDAGHFNTEWNVFTKLSTKLLNKFNENHELIEYLISENTKDVYQYISMV